MTKKKSGSSRQEKRIPASALFTPKTASRRVYVGRFYRPVKQQISVRVAADVLAWLRSRGKRYQTYRNDVLRRAMQSDLRRSGNSPNR